MSAEHDALPADYYGARWWIVGIMWQHESPEHPIPSEYSAR
jgi:hypothetical protein